jgi:uncharacterized protein with FMN-binding domain
MPLKKYILSFLLIMTFAVYIVYQRLIGTVDTAAVAISSIDSTTTTSVPSNDVIFPAPTPVVVPVSSPIPVPVSTPIVVNKPAPKPAPKAVPVSIPVPVVVANTGQYKDGSYTGVSANAYYGNIQVEAIISGGKLTDVQFLDHPQDRGTSIQINNVAMPRLRQEAIQAQSANVNTVSGATDSSGAFRQSLSSALAQAVNS